jgi:citrate lyase beta subunit
MGRIGERLRSLLFLPATRPDRLDRAFESEADRVCFDLEDGVGVDAKETAREEVMRLVAGGGAQSRLVIRINSPRTETGLRDVLALCAAPSSPIAVMIPKVESGEEVRWIADLLAARHPALRLHLLIETARGVEAAPAIAAVSARTEAIMFGGVDLSADLGAAHEWEPLLYARSRIVHAAAGAGIGALDSVVLDLSDAAVLRAEAERARRLGFTGKAAIHPRQVAAIHECFAPTSAEIARAQRVVAAYDESGGGVTVVDGELVDLPVVRSAQRILRLANAGEESTS